MTSVAVFLRRNGELVTVLQTHKLFYKMQTPPYFTTLNQHRFLFFFFVLPALPLFSSDEQNHENSQWRISVKTLSIKLWLQLEKTHGTFLAGRSSFKILEWIFPSPSQSTTDPSRTTALNWNAWILSWSGGSLKAYIMSYHRPLLTELVRPQRGMCPRPVLSPGTHGITGTLTPWCYAQTRDGMAAGGKCKPTHWQIAGDVYQKGVGEVRTQSLRSHALECRLMSSKWDLSLVQSVLSNCILSKYRAFATQPSPLIIITVHLWKLPALA